MTKKKLQYPVFVKYSRNPHRGYTESDNAFITDENDLLKWAQSFLGDENTQMACGRVEDERGSINNAIAENAEEGSFIASEKSKLDELDFLCGDNPFYIYNGGADEGYRYNFFRTAFQLLGAAAAHDHLSADIEVIGEGKAARKAFAGAL